MALVLADRVKETSTTTGTGTYTLAGAVSGFETFGSIGNGNTTYYACTLGANFEVGIGTYTSSGTTLARTTILQSSNSDSAVNWGAGTKTLFCTQPAEKAVFRDASGNVSVSGTITGTGTSVFTNLDISGDVDVDGTLEADAMTLNGTAITTTATLSTGISNNNVPKFTSGVADNDFLRVDGTAIEGRSASEVLSDIGGQASLTFGISNTNAVKIDSTSVADDEYARFTANGLESRSTSEVLSDIGGISASSTSTLTNKTLTTPVINGFSGTGDGSIIGDLTLTSTDGGATENPTLDLFRNSASPADGDVLGHVDFSGEDSAGNKTVYAKISADIADVTNGTEDGRLDIGVISAGSFSNRITLQGNGVTRFSNKDVELSNGISLRFEGSTGDANETVLTVTDPTSDRTITLPDVSGTVITTGNSDAPTTTTSSSDADFVLIDDGGTMKKITPANLGVPANKDYGLVTGSVTGTEDYGSVA